MPLACASAVNSANLKAARNPLGALTCLILSEHAGVTGAAAARVVLDVNDFFTSAPSLTCRCECNPTATTTLAYPRDSKLVPCFWPCASASASCLHRHPSHDSPSASAPHASSMPREIAPGRAAGDRRRHQRNLPSQQHAKGDVSGTSRRAAGAPAHHHRHAVEGAQRRRQRQRRQHRLVCWRRAAEISRGCRRRRRWGRRPAGRWRRPPGGRPRRRLRGGGGGGGGHAAAIEAAEGRAGRQRQRPAPKNNTFSSRASRKTVRDALVEPNKSGSPAARPEINSNL